MHAQLFADSGVDRVDLLASIADDFDDRIGGQIQSVIHRWLLNDAIGLLAESASSPTAAPSPTPTMKVAKAEVGKLLRGLNLEHAILGALPDHS